MENQGQKNEAAKQPEQETNALEPEPVPVVKHTPVKSRTDQVQETVDRNLAERNDRQKTTEELVAKRKRIADLKATAEKAFAASHAHSAEKIKIRRICCACGYIEPLPGPPTIHLRNWAEDHLCEDCDQLQADAAKQKDVDAAAAATDEIVAIVKKNAADKEQREVEMHNAQMDSMNAQLATLDSQISIFNKMCGTLTDISITMKSIASSLAKET